MCDYCKPILGSFAIPHEPDADATRCPLRKSQYCTVCAGYGHAAVDCTDPLGRCAEEPPQFLEQLIPPSLREKYGITTRTPLRSTTYVPQIATRPPLEVPYTEEDVRAALVAHDEKPMTCQATGKEKNRDFQENVKRLRALAERLGRKLILVPVAGAPVPQPTTKKSTK